MRNKRGFQTHLLVYIIAVVVLAVANGFDDTWLPAAGLWLIALATHGFTAYRLGPFGR
jgi:hypothetical protein